MDEATARQRLEGTMRRLPFEKTPDVEAPAELPEPTGSGKTIRMPKKKFVKEHTKLIRVLTKGTKAQRLKEAKEQKAELKGKGYSVKQTDPYTYVVVHSSGHQLPVEYGSYDEAMKEAKKLETREQNEALRKAEPAKNKTKFPPLKGKGFIVRRAGPEAAGAGWEIVDADTGVRVSPHVYATEEEANEDLRGYTAQFVQTGYRMRIPADPQTPAERPAITGYVPSERLRLANEQLLREAGLPPLVAIRQPDERPTPPRRVRASPGLPQVFQLPKKGETLPKVTGRLYLRGPSVRDGKWRVQNEKGEIIGGPYDTEAEAMDEIGRMRARMKRPRGGSVRFDPDTKEFTIKKDVPFDPRMYSAVKSLAHIVSEMTSARRPNSKTKKLATLLLPILRMMADESLPPPGVAPDTAEAVGRHYSFAKRAYENARTFVQRYWMETGLGEKLNEVKERGESISDVVERLRRKIAENKETEMLGKPIEDFLFKNVAGAGIRFSRTRVAPAPPPPARTLPIPANVPEQRREAEATRSRREMDAGERVRREILEQDVFDFFADTLKTEDARREFRKMIRMADDATLRRVLTGKGLKGKGGSAKAGFIRRMMGEIKLKHGGEPYGDEDADESYRHPTRPLAPNTKMDAPVAFDYFKMPKESRMMSKHIMEHLFRVRPYSAKQREQLNDYEKGMLAKAGR